MRNAPRAAEPRARASNRPRIRCSTTAACRRPNGRALLIVDHRRSRVVRQLQHQRHQGGRQIHHRERRPAVALGLVGRRGRDFFARRGFQVRYEQVNLFAQLKFENAQAIAAAAIEAFAGGEVDAVYLAYNEFKSVMVQHVAVEQLLPIPRGAFDTPAPPARRPDRRSNICTSRNPRSCSSTCCRATSRFRSFARCSNRTPRSMPRR